MLFFREQLSSPDTFMVGGASGEVDLAVMANCHASIIGEGCLVYFAWYGSDLIIIIIDYGTYGLWGAILAGGETVVSTKTFRCGFLLIVE